MKAPVFSKTVSLLTFFLSFTFLSFFTTTSSAHPVHGRHHPAARERVPFWNDPDWGTKAPETPWPTATVMPTRPIPSHFLLATTTGVADSKIATTPVVAVAAPIPTISPLKSAALKSAAPPSATGLAPPKPVFSKPPVPEVAPKPEKSCLDLSLWATASGRSPIMSVAGSLSKNKEPICSIWALVDQASPKPVQLSCKKGHEATFRFDNGGGRYEGDGQPVTFNVVRSEEAKADGKEAWSWRVRGCWDE